MNNSDRGLTFIKLTAAVLHCIRLLFYRSRQSSESNFSSIPAGGWRSGTISLMTKMMKLQLAPERSEREAAMPRKLTFMNIRTRNSRTSCRESSTDSRACRAPERLCLVLDRHEEPSFTLSRVNDILHESKLRAPTYQKTIIDFFSS